MYTYETEKPRVFTESGQVVFLRIRDDAHRLLKTAGAFRMQEVLGAGDSWQNMACVDRLVELGEIREIDPEMKRPGQHRVFVAARES
jgi:hypothetical protein